jgi:hypothetical protein
VCREAERCGAAEELHSCRRPAADAGLRFEGIDVLWFWRQRIGSMVTGENGNGRLIIQLMVST